VTYPSLKARASCFLRFDYCSGMERWSKKVKTEARSKYFYSSL
jgi:hypothetical protein